MEILRCGVHFIRVFCIIFLIVLYQFLIGCSSQKEDSIDNNVNDGMVAPHIDNNVNDGMPAPHIERNGTTYCYHGELTYELPEGYGYIGKGDDGNVYGKVYENPQITDRIYFLPDGWDIKRDGPRQPYLLFKEE